MTLEEATLEAKRQWQADRESGREPAVKPIRRQSSFSDPSYAEVERRIRLMAAYGSENDFKVLAIVRLVKILHHSQIPLAKLLAVWRDIPEQVNALADLDAVYATLDIHGEHEPMRPIPNVSRAGSVVMDVLDGL